MFKLVMYLNTDDASLNPFACSAIRSYLRDQILVMPQEMMIMTDGAKLLHDHGVGIAKLIVIGDKIESMESGADATRSLSIASLHAFGI